MHSLMYSHFVKLEFLSVVKDGGNGRHMLVYKTQSENQLFNISLTKFQ